MAYAAVASLLQTIDILLDHHQRSISPQFRNQIISIHQHTSSLQSFLEGFSNRANNWEETIREVTNRAEDTIELLLSDSLLESSHRSSRSEFEKGKYEVFYGFDELQRVTEEIEAIANRVKGKHTEDAVGSDEEVMKIIDRLRGGSSTLETIAIVGIGGIGKTTLARKAYNHPLVMEHFEVRSWSAISARHDWRQLDLLHSNKSKPDRPVFVEPDSIRARTKSTAENMSKIPDRPAFEELGSIRANILKIPDSSAFEELVKELAGIRARTKSMAENMSKIPDRPAFEILFKELSAFGERAKELDSIQARMKSTAEKMSKIPDRPAFELVKEPDSIRARMKSTAGNMSKIPDRPAFEELVIIRARTTFYRPSALMKKSKAENITNADYALVKSLHEVSGGNRYLIILDDISSIKDMEMLRLMLPDCRNGSRIILTTRSMGMSSSAHFYIHIMGLLDDDKAWDLLKRKILKGDPCPSRLEHVGKMIARRCKGHPLSIEVISGILAADQTEVAWEDVSENMYDSTYNDILMTPEVQNPFTHFELLNLSYRYLPHHLRPCFLYLGTFPKKEEMHVSKLIKLWVAEGFLNQSDCNSFEVVGEECVEDLVRRSLVSVSKRKSNGRIKSITIHDLMWDVCLRRAQEDNFILHHRRFGRLVEARKRQWCRRVCNLSDGKDILKGVYGSTIRSMFYGEDSYLGIEWSVGNVRQLRILDLTNVYYRYFPEEILQLFHLRYLALRSWSSISEAISNLQNLQTLIIGSKKKGSILPKGIWRLPQLRHLLNFCLELPREEGALSALENLQTLCTVKDFVCSRENLKVIPNLKKLAIFYTENFRNVGLQNLIYMQKLEILKIEMDWSFVEQHKMSYAFPSTLTKLNLCGLQLPWEDMKMVASLPNLEVLKLRNHACVGNTWETSEGGFSELTFLQIEESDLEHWITETTHFPKLKCLVLRHCLYLLEVPNGIGEIPTLESIELDEQNQSLLSSAKRIQKDQRSLGNDRLRVHVE